MATPAPTIFLVGMMASGKTTIGVRLADACGRRYVDNDELVVMVAGQTARQLLRVGGTAAVRGAEAAALRLGIRAHAGSVVGVAAGTVLDAGNRRILNRAGTVVWLRAKPEALARRIAEDDSQLDGAHRPWHEANLMSAGAWLTREAVRRAPLYERVSAIAVDTDDASGADRPIEEIVDEICQRIPDMRPGGGRGGGGRQDRGSPRPSQ